MAHLLNQLRERLLQAGVAPRHVRRYVSEIADHLSDLRAQEERYGRSQVEAEAAALSRIGGKDELVQAMLDRGHYQAWSVRAPWAVFGILPLILLAGAYLVACLILWSGWKVFLPGTNTPFVRVDGFAVVYFGVGRLLYYSAPILIGWSMGVIAARQRLKAFWPAGASILVSLIGSAAQVHAARSNPHEAAGTISMSFDPTLSLASMSAHVLPLLLVFSVTMLPYLIWRRQKQQSIAG